MGGAQLPATSGTDAEAAREAAGDHAATAESIERAMPMDSSPGPESSPGDPEHGEE
jgi:hypothetical protein